MPDEPSFVNDICTQVQLTGKAIQLHLSQKSVLGKNEGSVRHYLERSLSANTRKAYKEDLEHFYAAGYSIPATPETVAGYLADYAGDLAVSTLTRRLAAINKAHEIAGHPSPTKSETVRLVMRGIRREHSVKQKQAAPLLRDDLIAIINQLPNDVRGKRDRAMIMTGFAAALRRSELTGLNVEDVEFVTEGAVLHIRKSKTDQEGHGRKIAIPYAKGRHCPVKSLKEWIECITGDGQPLFRSIRKGGHIQPDRLSDNAVSCMVKEYAEKIGLDPANYSGHSLRAGFVTSAAQLGIPEWRIMRQSGHKSHQTMMRYVRDARLFEEHPLEAMF